MFIDRKETIEQFKNEHQKLKELVTSLPQEQILKKETLGEWSIKDIATHLAAWNWEAVDEVKRVLNNEATWPDRYEDKAGEEEFNRKEVEKRKDNSWQEVLKDWDDSFWAQIELMEKLTDEQWKHQSGDETWSDGNPVTVYSLFGYEYEGEGHEGGHAKQVKKQFKV
ncbi:DinB family protein [Candidatus Daviesbacteria bacterium]|nr:DinB family protein [Candidatus Daviesbacteria bacterium]